MKTGPGAIVAATLSMLTLSVFVTADVSGDHPAYLHALADLRHARALLDRYTPSENLIVEQESAIKEIKEAIREIKEAAIDDGKDTDAHPSLDLQLDLTGRLHKALEVLSKTRADIDKREDNAFAHDLKHRALKHIDEARRVIAHTISALPQASGGPCGSMSKQLVG
jgi:hypothetical protein